MGGRGLEGDLGGPLGSPGAGAEDRERGAQRSSGSGLAKPQVVAFETCKGKCPFTVSTLARLAPLCRFCPPARVWVVVGRGGGGGSRA